MQKTGRHFSDLVGSIEGGQDAKPADKLKSSIITAKVTRRPLPLSTSSNSVTPTIAAADSKGLPPLLSLEESATPTGPVMKLSLSAVPTLVEETTSGGSLPPPIEISTSDPDKPQNRASDEFDAAMMHLIDVSFQRAVGERLLKERKRIERDINAAKFSSFEVDPFGEELDPEEVKREEKRNLHETIMCNQFLGPADIRRCISTDEEDDPWPEVRARAAKEATRLVEKYCGVMATSHRLTSTLGSVNAQPTSSKDCFVDEETGTCIRIWSSRNFGRLYVSALRALSVARHSLLLPPMLVVPYAVSAACHGKFVTVTWMPPIQHTIPCASPGRALQADEGAGFVHCALDLLATYFQLDRPVLSERKPLAAPWALFAGMDDRFYLFPLSGLFRNSVAVNTRLPESNSEERFEYIATDVLGAGRVHLALTRRLVPLIKQRAAGLIKVAKQDRQWISRPFHACGVGMKHLLVVRNLLRAEQTSANAKQIEVIDSLLCSEVLARAMKSIILRQGVKLSRGLGTGLGTPITSKSAEDSCWTARSAEDSGSHEDSNSHASTMVGLTSSPFVNMVNSYFTKMLQSKKFLSTVVLTHIYRKYEDASTFLLDLSMINLPIVIRHLEWHLGLRFDAEAKMFREATQVCLLSQSGRDSMDVASLVNDEAVLAEQATGRLISSADSAASSAATSLNLLALYFALIGMQNGAPGADNIFKGAVSRAAQHVRDLQKDQRMQRESLYFMLIVGKLSGNMPLVYKALETLAAYRSTPSSNILSLSDGLFIAAVFSLTYDEIEETRDNDADGKKQLMTQMITQWIRCISSSASWRPIPVPAWLASQSGSSLQPAGSMLSSSVVCDDEFTAPLDILQYYSEESLEKFGKSISSAYGSIVRKDPVVEAMAQHAMLLVAWCALPIPAADLICRNHVRNELCSRIGDHSAAVSPGANGDRTRSGKLALERLVLRMKLCQPEEWVWAVAAMTFLPQYRKEFRAAAPGALSQLFGASKSSTPPIPKLPDRQLAEEPLLLSLAQLFQEAKHTFDDDAESLEAALAFASPSLYTTLEVMLTSELRRLRHLSPNSKPSDSPGSPEGIGTQDTVEKAVLQAASLLREPDSAKYYILKGIKLFLRKAEARAQHRKNEALQRDVVVKAQVGEWRALMKSEDDLRLAQLKVEADLRAIENQRRDDEAARIVAEIRNKQIRAAAQKAVEELAEKKMHTIQQKRQAALEKKQREEKEEEDRRVKEETLARIREAQSERYREMGKKAAEELAHRKAEEVREKVRLEHEQAEQERLRKEQEAEEERRREETLQEIRDKIHARAKAAGEKLAEEVARRKAEEFERKRKERDELREKERLRREQDERDRIENEQLIAQMQEKHQLRIKRQSTALLQQVVVKKIQQVRAKLYLDKYPNICIGQSGFTLQTPEAATSIMSSVSDNGTMIVEIPGCLDFVDSWERNDNPKRPPPPPMRSVALASLPAVSTLLQALREALEPEAVELPLSAALMSVPTEAQLIASLKSSGGAPSLPLPEVQRQGLDRASAAALNQAKLSTMAKIIGGPLQSKVVDGTTLLSMLHDACSVCDPKLWDNGMDFSCRSPMLAPGTGGHSTLLQPLALISPIAPSAPNGNNSSLGLAKGLPSQKKPPHRLGPVGQSKGASPTKSPVNTLSFHQELFGCVNHVRSQREEIASAAILSSKLASNSVGDQKGVQTELVRILNELSKSYYDKSSHSDEGSEDDKVAMKRLRDIVSFEAKREQVFVLVKDNKPKIALEAAIEMHTAAVRSLTLHRVPFSMYTIGMLHIASGDCRKAAAVFRQAISVLAFIALGFLQRASDAPHASSTACREGWSSEDGGGKQFSPSGNDSGALAAVCGHSDVSQVQHGELLMPLCAQVSLLCEADQASPIGERAMNLFQTIRSRHSSAIKEVFLLPTPEATQSLCATLCDLDGSTRSLANVQQVLDALLLLRSSNSNLTTFWATGAVALALRGLGEALDNLQAFHSAIAAHKLSCRVSGVVFGEKSVFHQQAVEAATNKRLRELAMIEEIAASRSTQVVK